jgi:hypothetical protein
VTGATPYWNGTTWITGSANIYNNGGNVGIGTSTPSSKLDVNGTAVISGSLELKKAGSTTLGASQLYINGATTNRIDFAGTGLGAPSVSRSAGTKLVLWPGTVGSSVDYALGMDSSTFWFSLGNSSDSFKWYAGATEIARLTGDGNLGVGTASPAAKLHIVGGGSNDSTPEFRIDGAAGQLSFYNNLAGGNYNSIVQAGDKGIIFDGGTSNTGNLVIAPWGDSTGVRITSAGNVGIGVSSPAEKLDVNGNLKVASTLIAFGNTINSSTATAITLAGADVTVAGDLKVSGNGILDSGANTHITLGTTAFTSATTTTIMGDLRVNGNDVRDSGGTSRVTLGSTLTLTGLLTNQATYDNTAAGSTVVVTSTGLIRRTSSSSKYKKDIENLNYSIVSNAIENLRPVWYRSINPAGDDKASWSHVGLIAEEAHLVEPRIVRYRTAEISVDEEGNRVETQLESPEPEDVDYGRLAVLLLAEVRAQKELIKQLTQRIETLEGT